MRNWKDEKTMKKTLLVSLIFFASIVYGQIKNPKAQAFFTNGVEQYESDNYKTADSLFNLSLNIEPSSGAYFYLAISKKKQNDSCGYCENLNKSALQGDKNSYRVYATDCIKKDSVTYKDISNSDILYYSTTWTTTCLSKKEQFFSKKYLRKGTTTTFSLVDNDSIKNTFYNSTFPDIEKIPTENIVYLMVNEMPQYPGGDTKRINFLARNIKYPKNAMKKGIQGTVFVTFILDETGSVTNAEILKGIGGGCDEEAIRLVKLMPRWKPAKDNGKPVRFRFNMPLRFTLN